MHDPFFYNNFHPYTYSPPSRRQPPSPPQPSSQRKPRKVFLIPVHHVDSEKKRSESATKIQKTFRGFRVRKTVKKILELKREVDDVENKLFEGETMAVIRKNSLERLKVTEGLMAVLFKLDSVRGFDGGVREFRKKVITKAIMLQEIVDSAVNGSDDDNMESCGETDVNVDKLTENFDDSSKIEGVDGETLGEGVEGVNEIERIDEFSKMQVENSEELEACNEIEVNVEKLTENFNDSSRIRENIVSETLGEDAEAIQNDRCDGLSKMQIENSVEIESERNCNENGTETLEKIDGIVEDEALADDNAESWECVGDETEEQKSDLLEVPDNGCVENSGTTRNSGKEEWCVIGSGSGNGSGCGGEEKEKKEKLMEKMVEDNQKLMAMVADLCQKNAMQTRLICSLSQRVEQLEKAMSDRLRRKKKKCNASLH